ncbi:hypothetical protein RND81_05G019900 [Saponaria officinalis]|uniref:Uncharacterized protein n=1 Tax=Saponaria officinalis TaxID=3572 RepID=A0AAW1KS04_SAPOF
MEMKKCMNIHCGATSCVEWKTGWRLRSGEVANLCDKCGYLFEQQIFCDKFHNDDTGWRNCVTCEKRLHCGCIASLDLITLVFPSGVKCIDCAKKSLLTPSSNGEKYSEDELCAVNENCVGVINFNDIFGNIQRPLPFKLYANAALGLLKIEGPNLPASETGSHPTQNITSSVSSGNLQLTSGTVTHEREQKNASVAFNQDSASPSLTPTPPTLPSSPAPNTILSMMPQLCLGRCPVEGRGRHQLLSRYRPRITNQELQEISGNSNCTVVPLFEKVLSASDVGPTGRLVLPKACAEAYFPAISQPEGIPIKVHDVKAKEWAFQFRYWPNNNSRMYVLEGVSHCVQSMQLEAGDTVTFCRMEPEGKLVMSFRKSSDSSVQPMTGSIDACTNALPRQPDSAGENVELHNIDKCGEPTEEGSSRQMTKMPKKKSRDVASKGLHVYNQDAQALRLTCEEAQGMLLPPPNAKPNVVVIDGFEFEEYKEPPVIGKSSVFAACSSGETEQWAQCDNCSKWRRLPADFRLPPTWTCSDNSWDPARWFCSAPDELSPEDLEDLINLSKGSKKKRMRMSYTEMEEQEFSGISTIVDTVDLEDNPNEAGTSAVTTTSNLQSLDD